MVAVTSGPVKSAVGLAGKQLEHRMADWRILIGLRFYEDCRGIVQIVEETESERIWERLGYKSVQEFYLKELRLDPNGVPLAYSVTKKDPLSKLGWDDAVANAKVKGPGLVLGTNQHSKDGGCDSITPSSDRGTSQSYTLRRLLRDNPELFARVEAGELSPNKAAIEAGFRHPPITLTAKTKPEEFWTRVRERFGDEYADRLRDA